MRKINGILILPLMLIVASCNKNNIDPKNNIIQKLLECVNIKISGNEYVSYPDKYSYLNSTTPININRDYKTIIEPNGNKTPAVRDNNNFITYFRGENGQAISEVLTSDNQVVSKNYQYYGLDILYSDLFANPFEFIDTIDIGEDYSLTNSKASFIIEKFTGLNYAVKDAKFVIDSDVAKSLLINTYDRQEAIVTQNGFIDVNYSLDIKIDFDYTIGNIEHLTPRKEADNVLKEAFNNNQNYTMTFESDSLTSDYIIYVTEEATLIHKGINDIGLNDGDEYYQKASENSYIKYSYSSSTNKFSIKNMNVAKEEFLPNLSSVSPNILLKSSDNIYLFDKQAATYGLEKMILPMFSVNSGSGNQGTLIIKDGHFSSLTAQFGDYNSLLITQNYSNYGNTSLPDWFDQSII
ncbi:MAG: hypothetical protein PUG55_02535 [Bacillales bacterium]|nr:hypothetical protein [Bacillales bacterium]